MRSGPSNPPVTAPDTRPCGRKKAEVGGESSRPGAVFQAAKHGGLAPGAKKPGRAPEARVGKDPQAGPQIA